MNPQVWGPHLWFSLHTVTFSYPFYPDTEQKQQMKEFFLSIQNILPCMLCREHYKEHLQANPIEPALESRGELAKWLIGVHNSVNKSLGKPEWTEADAVHHYERIYGHPIVLYPGTTELTITDEEPLGQFWLVAGIAALFIVAGLYVYFQSGSESKRILRRRR